LWPETLVAYGSLKKSNIFTKMLYQGEKWIYKKADKLIFTMEGGKEYIIDQGWDKKSGGPVDIRKVYHINNGVDLEAFNYNKENYQIKDKDLDDPNTFKVVYTGSIRRANSLEKIVDAADYINKKGKYNIIFLIYGDGNEKKYLEEKSQKYGLNNIIFKGRIEKQKIPYILSKSSINLLNYEENPIWEYGGSQNKKFEYLASGKPILATIKEGYDIIEKNNAGFISKNNYKDIGEIIIKISEMNKTKYLEMKTNAKNLAKEYDFKKLTDKLIKIIEK
jgi:glycosyltransferase involved in cell wall biosynthesis